MSAPAKKTRTCKKCGRKLKQKYTKLCIYCKQAEKRRKKEERELRKELKQETKNGFIEKLLDRALP